MLISNRQRKAGVETLLTKLISMEQIVVREAGDDDARFAHQIAEEMYKSAIARGSGISKRSPESLVQKMKEGKAVIAVTENKEWVGFSYIEVWASGEFVSNSGLIVSPGYRGEGTARRIKEKIFALSREKYPGAKIFSITTGLAIIRMNASLGFDTVTFNELPKERAFWQGCKSCVNYDILQRKGYKNCLCTAMLFEPLSQPRTAKSDRTDPVNPVLMDVEPENCQGAAVYPDTSNAT